MVGEIVELPQDTSECLGKFMRVRVKVGNSKPLRRGLWVNLEDFDTTITTLIRYKRLPEFCFGCGMVGYSIRECIREGPNRGGDSLLKYGYWLRASTFERQKAHNQIVESLAKTEQSSDGDREGYGRSFVRLGSGSDRNKTERDQCCSTNKMQLENRGEELQYQCQKKKKELTLQEKSNQLLITAAKVMSEEGVGGSKIKDPIKAIPKSATQEGDLPKTKYLSETVIQLDKMDCQPTLSLIELDVEPKEKEIGKERPTKLIQVDGAGSQDERKGVPRNRKWKRAARSPKKPKSCILPSPLKQLLAGGLNMTSPKSRKLYESPKSKKKLVLSPKVKVGISIKRKSDDNQAEKFYGKKYKCSLLVGISVDPELQDCRTP